jgi:protein-tyrosine phosphatase
MKNACKDSPTLSGRHHRIHFLNEEFALHVLFVCTGNICRSPTAERLAAAYATQLQIPNFRASSAGTRAVISHPIHNDAALVLEKLGGDASDFAARQLTSRIASDADLVLTMTKAHRDAVLELAPRQLHRTFTLSEAARLALECHAQTVADLAALRPHLAARDLSDIPDPIGQSAEFHAMVGSQIADLLPPILELCLRS